MSDTFLVKDENDALWARIRAALEAMRPRGGREREPAYGRAAIARALGVRAPLGGRIEEALARAWSHCAERKVTLSLLVIGADRFKDLHLVYDKDGIDHQMRRVEKALRKRLAQANADCLRHGRGEFVLLLPDCPILLARNLAEKLLRDVQGLGIAHKESHAGVLTAGAGLAAINPAGAPDRRFFEAAASALAKAQRRGLGRIEMVDLRAHQQRKAG
ncbi:hypothetical protein VE25_18170 [Devosia geojensis]|uniref:GGDEF domain-containing protein n=1 Tax=Devosia geojensis TaxID=443610 RepID=A0A0F5FI48_9HYPH|nr:diguanylate cyclase [Devosia geojensis]KKB08549.1 hypothetical protein VE25_18170 [Devosia geojensis]